MAVNYGKIAKQIFYFPANSLSLLVSALFVSHRSRDENYLGIDKKDYSSILGLTLYGLRYTGQKIADFFANNNVQTGIAAAFWVCLIPTLMLALWPAALTAVTTASISGVSMTSVFAGASSAALVAMLSGLLATLTFFTASLISVGVNAADRRRKAKEESEGDGVELLDKNPRREHNKPSDHHKGFGHEDKQVPPHHRSPLDTAGRTAKSTNSASSAVTVEDEVPGQEESQPSC